MNCHFIHLVLFKNVVDMLWITGHFHSHVLGDGCNILAFLSQYRYTAMYALLFVATLVQYFVTAGTSPG